MQHELAPSNDLASYLAAYEAPRAATWDKPYWMFKGLGSVLRFQPLLAKLAERSGLAGEADSLEYFLTAPDALKKRPYLLLIGSDRSGNWSESTGAGIEAAVLLFEYGSPVRGTRVLSSADSTGRRNVLAVPECRASAAAFAARRMLQEGAQVVRIAFSETHQGSVRDAVHRAPPTGAAAAAIEEQMGAMPGCSQHGQWTFNEESVKIYLPLLKTVDATLARIGQRTRSNLRYYRRRCEQENGSRFLARVVPSLEDFLAFNADSMYAVDEKLARWRYSTLSMPQCRLCAVRSEDGRWLAMAGLRQHGDTCELDWQMNRAGMNAASLATVLRAYLIEDEIARGSTRLYIEGGTTQPIRLSFEEERVSELIVKRRSLYVSALEHSAGRVFGARNRLAQCLGSSTLHWRAW